MTFKFKSLDVIIIELIWTIQITILKILFYFINLKFNTAPTSLFIYLRIT